MTIKELDLASAITAGLSADGGNDDSGPTGDDVADESADVIGSGEEGQSGAGDESASGEDAAGDAGDATGGTDDGTADGEEGSGSAPGAEGAAAGKKDGAAADGSKPGAAGADKQAKKPDPLNDPIPNATKGATRERIQSLITSVKSVTGERDTIKAQRDELMSFIQETGATPEQYTETLGVLKLLNSGEPADLEQAFKYVQDLSASLATRLGKPIAGRNMLEGHDDLAAEVAEGQISQERAEEIAAARNQRKMVTDQSTQRTAQQQQQQQQAQAVATARASLNTWGADMQAKDPQFAAKWQILQGALTEMATTFPPDKWLGIVQRAYAKVQLGQIAAARSNGGVKPGVGQPLRAKTPAGGAVSSPKDLMAAINMGLGRTSAE